MPITRTNITTRMMKVQKHIKKDDDDVCDGEEDKDEDEDKMRRTRTRTKMKIVTMATIATIDALAASGEQQDSHAVRSHGDGK